MHTRLLAVALFGSLVVNAASVQVTLPIEPDSLRMAVIGDSGTGDRPQYQVAEVMAQAHGQFPFELTLMLGDNIYGGESPRDFHDKFERPYQPLLDAGVKFYASLGNHDSANQRFYRLFNMNGERYYSFKTPRQDARIFALDSNYMDPQQLRWIARALEDAGERWKIVFFHHPLYSSGERHGSDEELRKVLEPSFIKHGVNVVFAGHEHFYERIKPQNGVYYFTSGGAAKLRKGNIATGPLTAKGFDRDRSFMLVEIVGDELYFQTIARDGTTVDSGVIRHPKSTQSTTSQPQASRWLHVPRFQIPGSTFLASGFRRATDY